MSKRHEKNYFFSITFKMCQSNPGTLASLHEAFIFSLKLAVDCRVYDI
jgi:hypothetical protein